MADLMYQFVVNDIKGEEVPMEKYRGKVMLVVNTASKCGLTAQYEGLEALYKKHKDKGFEILGFPCNQFKQQEPGDSNEISQFCELNFGVTFPLFQKLDVNGPAAHPLFKHLKSEAPGLLGSEGIKWNFTKFLIDREGRVVKRFAPTDQPKKIEKELEKLLA